MAATLRMCLMVHVEDANDPWDGTVGANFGNDKTALSISSLADRISVAGAKLSVQFSYRYLNDGDYPLNANVTSLKVILDRGGNFWPHTHSASYNHLQSAYSCVKSVYRNESGGDAVAHVRGRSGGWVFDLDPGSGQPYDWVSITQHVGLRVMNSAVMMAHALVPETMRPYGYTNDEIEKLHHHDAAPGPLDPDIGTMRIRPFWMNTASTWFDRVTSIYPHESWVGSVMMIPQPSRTELKRKAQGRTAYSVDTLTEADLTVAMTEIWSTYKLGEAHQNSITRVWYTHINPNMIKPDTIPMIQSWVCKISSFMDIGGATPKGSWHNMNEIADLFSHYDAGNPSQSSFYY